MSDILGSILVELGVDPSKLKAGFKSAISDAKSAGDAAGSAWGVGFSSPVLNAIAGVGDAVQGVRESLAFLGNVSGSSFASEMQGYRRSLQYISGDADKAERALKSFQNTAATSQFDAGAVTRFGLNIAGRTGDVTGAARDTARAVDAAQVAGVDRAHFDAFQVNLSQIQNRGNNKVEMPDLQQLRDYAPTLTAAIAKSMGVSVATASDKIKNATGTELSNMILGLGDSNKGAAAAATGNDPYAVAANTVDSFNQAMEPTGRIINATLLPLAQGAQYLVERFGDLNQVTGGGAGLVVTITAGYLAARKFGSGLMETYSAAKLATQGLREVAAAANSAAAAEETETATKNSRGIAGFAADNAGFGIPFLTSSLISYVGNQNMEASRKARASGNTAKADHDEINARRLADAAVGASIGGTIGFLAGSVIPGIGNVAGAALGTLAGAGIGNVVGESAAKKEISERHKAESKLAGALNDNTKTLEKLNFKGLGGGTRSQSALSMMEAELSVVRTSRTGLA